MYWRYMHMTNWKIWNKKFNKDDRGFTGLKAAIVLVAEFFAARKSKEVDHTGMDQAIPWI
jgi:hypothetical protein